MIGSKRRSERRGAGDEANRWFVRMSSDTKVPAEEEAFYRWLKGDPRNEREYRQIQELWGELGEYAEAPELRVARERARGQKRGWFRFIDVSQIRYAAAAVLVACGVITFAAYVRSPTAEPTRFETYITGAGERASVTLPDQSVLMLGPGTQIAVDVSSGSRRVVLTHGLVFFDIRHDAARPFTVVAQDRAVRVLGTEFEVNSDNGLSVTLVAGHVQIANCDECAPIADLSPGQRFEARANVVRVAQVDAAQDTAWRSGRLVFNDRPLNEALGELNRFLTSPIEIVDAELGGLRISGTFKIGETRALIEALQASAPIEADIDSRGVVRLRRR